MSNGEHDDEQPITEDDLARMFAEEEAGADEPEANLEQEPVEEPQTEAELPETPAADQAAEDGELPAEELETAVAEHLAWAERRNLISFEDATKLAWEQEKFLGKRASEIEDLRNRLTEFEIEGPSAEQTRTDDWMASALSSPDPGRYAFELASSGEWGTYQQYMSMWESMVGESVTMTVHQQIIGALEEAEPEPQPTSTIAEGFATAGVFDLTKDPLVPMIKQVADEMGAAHPLVQGAARGEGMAIQAIVEIARARATTQRTVRLDGTPVDSEDRRRAAAVTGEGGAPRRTPPAKDPLAAETEEWKRMGVLPVE